MAKAETYDELVFQLGDLAREQLGNKPNRPRAMERVFKAEDSVLAQREALVALEQQMNDEDQSYQDFIAQQADEQEAQKLIIERFRKAVSAIEGRVKDLRKQLNNSRADLRYNKENYKKSQARHAEYEVTTFDAAKIDVSKQNLKKTKLGLMRRERDIEEQEQRFLQLLTPEPGQPGAPGILAHRRMLEMEDLAEARLEAFDEAMAELDHAIARKEDEIRAAEDYLDQATFLLGEECYRLRVPDTVLAALYPRIDKVAP